MARKCGRGGEEGWLWDSVKKAEAQSEWTQLQSPRTMTERPRRRSDGLLLALVPCLALLLWLDCCPAAAAVQKNRCDTPAAITTKQCNSCLKLRNCPVGFKLNGSSAGRQDCRYIFNPLSKISVSLVGCSYECYKEVLEPQCCPGHWGYDCLGFVGTACEDCEENRYGPTCSSELPKCAALGCSSNGRCIEDAHTGVLACRCLPGYEGDGTRCTPINPCMQKVCHQNAVCSILGPNQYSCTCAEGYQGDGKVCMPVDPCQTNLGGCPVDSTRCVYDGPGKSHCECQDGFENLVPGIGCSLTDICQPSSCDKNANCTTIKPGVVECICHEGYRGDGKTCYGNIMQQLQELNTNPKGQWCNQLTNAITLFKSSLSWPLSSLGPFTIFVPINKGFKGTSVKTLVADQVGARYLSKLHMVAGELTLETLKRGDVFYTLTGKSAESIVSDGVGETGQDQLVKIRIHGSRKKGDVLDSDILASNGVIHIISKLMDSVAPTVKSEKERSNMAHLLDDPSPYTLFVPTDAAMNVMKEGYLDYLCSDQGKAKLLELLRNHIIPSVKLEVVNMVSTESFMSMANQPLAFNVTSNGQILVNEQAILEADVEAKNGRLYSVDGVLIPSSIEPVLPHRCDVTKYSIIKGLCVSCTQVTKSICPSGEPLIPLCCEGFFGPDCSACPGGFTKPCSGHGKCMDGLEGNGTCVCDENFRGSRCQYCSRPDKHGPNCDKTCPCIHGQCDNRPESDGACKVDSCQMGFTGRFCERNTKACGPNAQFCHAYAECDFSEKAEGTIRCVCKPGYQGDGITCAEMDSCAPPHRGGCGVNAKCVKTGPQTHVCQCLTGWRADGDECQAINNCLEPNRGGCHDNATCIYVGPGQATCQYLGPGHWKCVCEDGYEGDGQICYGTVAQELLGIPEAAEFSKWVNDAGLNQMLSETQNFTLFLPSSSAVENMAKEDKDFWTEQSNLASIVKYHMVHGVHQLVDLRNRTFPPQLASFLKNWLPISRANEQYNLTQEIEESSAYTVFAPTDSAIGEYLKKTGNSSLTANITRYHIVLSDKLMQKDLRDGTYLTTMLGFNFQVGIFLRDNRVFVNDALVNLTDVETDKGVIHGLSSVLEIKRQCCAGYFGDQCEPCPGPVGLPCFGNGACHDGTNGTGVCRCSKGFDGTACESCQTGKYGMSCDQECQCVQGRCSEGPQGTGACECDMGWRGVNCDTVITQDTCKGKCHTSANCLMLPDGSSTCKCAAGFEGNGTYCSVVDACKDNNGGCSANAICKQTLPEINPCLAGNADCHVNAMCLHTGPNKAACICHNGYSGDGKTCAPIDLCQKRNGGCHALAQCEMTGPDERNCSCKEGYTGDGLTCKGTVFSLREWRVQGVMPHILRNHIVACRTLHHEELKTPRNVTTLHGETLSITYSQGDIYINNKAKVVFADDVSLNGIIYEIDAVLLPESVQRAPKGGGEDQAPVTLFWPTDRAMDSLPQAQKDFLYNNQNRAQLVEYLKYHVVRDAEGDLFLNDRKCRIVRRHMAFNGGIAYGIDCLLTPPSLGGRCDTTNVLEIKAGIASESTTCPGGPESPCGSRGKCDEGHLGNGTCTCDPGFRGAACELCLEGRYGSSCQTCNCTEHGSCDRGRMGTGSCFCDQGWTGPRCESQLETASSSVRPDANLTSDLLLSAAEPACTPACSPNAVCKANNTCECKPFYDGDGIACTVADLCKLNNGGCSKVAKCTQKGVKVTCACLKGYQGDGHACVPINLCSAADGGGCHEHATCTMLGPGKKKCECKSGYIGDGVTCEVKELPINRCAQDNGQCNVDALCTDLHYEDKKMGVFHLRSPKGQYKLTYAEAQDACRKDGAVIASYTQLSYAQQAGFSLCSAGWLENARVGYPTTFSSLTCGFGHVGIVDYGTRGNLSETWDVFCYRVKDVSCACKAGYVGDGYTCSGNLMQVLASRPIFSNFLSQIINYSSSSELGKEFVKRLSNLSIQSTLFVPDNNGLYENQTLSTRDIEYHLSDGGAVCFQDMTNGTRIRTRLGHSLRVLGIANFTNPSVLTPMRYINDRFIVEWDILASNGIIHVLQGPLHAPPPEPEFHKGHQVGVGLGVLLVALLVAVAGFAGYRFYTQNSKPFHFHYFKDNEDNDAAVVVSDPNISNPVYESGSSQGLPVSNWSGDQMNCKEPKAMIRYRFTLTSLTKVNKQYIPSTRI
ncbi:stabilin-2-like [Scleropages formosus]|uniref:Stabilin-2-like n=1 Tax=Scleropages formosus TaxID=113540 RepID=A0A0P7UWR4_SCLFO|nr:stabilin-2-like [Scleropages formosus]